MSSSLSSQPRLPRYEGHLLLDQAILADIPQTSACEAWSERWCSLEEGKLLVYKDRTCAMINPDHTCASIDIRNYGYLNINTTCSEPSPELVLSTTAPEPPRSAWLFRPKSALNLNRLHAESISESEPRLSIASSGRVSFQTPASSLNASSLHSPKTEAEGRSKPWSKFASGSRKFYSKVAASNSSLYDASLFLASSAASSIKSLSLSLESMDLALSGAPSPTTPLSSLFSNNLDRIVLRAPSAEALDDWLEALTRTIKLHNDTTLMPSQMMRYQKRVSLRPSMGNLPGFRTPTSLQSSPMFPTVQSSPTVQSGELAYMDDATPKATRKCLTSSTSSTFGRYTAFQELCQSPVRQQHDEQEVSTSENLNSFQEHITINQPPKRTNASPALSSFASQVFPAVDSKRQRRSHKRSLSTASSSLSFSGAGCLSTNRRNSIWSSQLLSSDGVDLSAPTQVKSGSIATGHSAVHSGPRSSPPLNDDRDVSRATISGGTLPLGKHRRSGSILRFGSARILAWRDNFTASDSTRQEPAAGLGLRLEQAAIVGESSGVEGSDVQVRQLKPSRGFPRLRSFRLLPKAKVNDGETSFTSPSEQSHTNPDASFSQPAKLKGMSRTTSLLNLTKHTLSSLRERSTSRQSVRQVFAVSQEDMQDSSVEQLQHSSPKRVETPGCDFSYEFVGPTREASRTHSPGLVSDNHVSDGSDASARLSPDFALKLNLVLTAEEEYLVRSSTPPFPVERILPPEQIISTFDQLRLADPTGRSCDWLSQIETVTRRGSLDRAAAASGSLKEGRELRLAVSQHDLAGSGSVDLGGGERRERRLRNSLSAWNLPQATAMRDCRVEREREQKREVGEEVVGRARTPSRLSEKVGEVRSLPAPPRASKSKARISTSMPKSPLGTTSLLLAVEVGVLGQVTNTSGVSSKDGGDKVEKVVLNQTAGVIRTPRSPSRRLGPTRRRTSPAASSPTCALAKGLGSRVAPLA